MRYSRDLEMHRKLAEHPDVRAARDRIVDGARRELLTTSVRVTTSMSPDLHRLIAKCRDALAIKDAVEVYVSPSAFFNAFCYRPESGRALVAFTSALLDSFEEDELAFVAGHELGHHLYEHHTVPVRNLVTGKSNGPLALQLYAWSRYAEISADRAGLACTSGLDPAARALFKLASGIARSRVKLDVEDFVSQLAEAGPSTMKEDWFTTHPFSPLRIQALRGWAGTRSGKTTEAEHEAELTEMLATMEPSYLEDKSDEAETMRRFLFAAGAVVAGASGGIAAEEVAAMARFFHGMFAGGIDVEALKRTLDERARDVCENVAPLRRAQLVRDLCVIALADGSADEAERKALEELATMIEVEPLLVGRTLAKPADLD